MHLITGGCGQVGAYVAQALLARRERIAVFDTAIDLSLLTLLRDGAPLGEIEAVAGDMAGPSEFIAFAIRVRPRTIVHLASAMPPVAERDSHYALAQITGAMVNVLEAARLLDVRRVVFASATSVFGPPASHGGQDVVVADDAPHDPRSLYGITKSANERLARLYRERHGVDSLGFRFCQGYGPGKRRGRPYGYQMFERALEGGACAVPYGDDIINWQYIGDIAEIVLRGIDAPYRGVGTYNTSGEIITMRAAMALLEELAPGFRAEFVPGTADMVWRYDDSAVRRDLALPPATSVAEGFATTLETMRRWRASA